MGGCSRCYVDVDLPYQCSYCEALFCPDHRLPESHDCPNLWMAKSPRRVEYGASPQRPAAGGHGFSSVRLRFPSAIEARHLIIAWLVLGIAFSARWLFAQPSIVLLMVAVSLITVGLGFIFHELSHKFTAEMYDCWAEFRMWPWALAMALVLAVASRGGFIFAAPGATYIVSRRLGGLTRRENGLVSLAGPITNIALAMVFIPLQFWPDPLSLIGWRGFQVNLWLAAFNMIPFGALDGQKVISWSVPIWAMVAVPLWLWVLGVLFVF